MARFAILAVPLVTALAAGPAFAGQSTATIDVSLVVQPACRVSAEPLVFAGRAGDALDAQSAIDVSCNGDVPLAVSLDGGAHASGGARRLAGEGDYVVYALYTDAARLVPWQPGMPLAGTAENGRLAIAAYGRVERGATMGANGRYSDTVAITVDF